MKKPPAWKFEKYTMSEKILLAAYRLGNGRENSGFTKEALVVMAWKESLQTFGLKGYEQLYPDSNKVLSALSHNKGVIKCHGWLVLKDKMLSLTILGVQAAKALLGQGLDAVVAENKKPLPLFQGLPEQVCWVLGKLQMPVVEKFNGDIKTITWLDACQVWNVAPFATELQLEKALGFFEEKLQELEIMLDKKPEKIIRVSDDRVIGMNEVRFIGNVHRRLRDVFEKKRKVFKTR